MSSVSFLYINITALCCYVLMSCMFLAARKTPETRVFLLMLLDSVCWLGGSVLMRVQARPGLAFWFYVSLAALFCMPVLFFIAIVISTLLLVRSLIQLTLLVSKSVLLVTVTILCFVMALSWAGPIEHLLIAQFSMNSGLAGALAWRTTPPYWPPPPD